MITIVVDRRMIHKVLTSAQQDHLSAKTSWSKIALSVIADEMRVAASLAGVAVEVQIDHSTRFPRQTHGVDDFVEQFLRDYRSDVVHAIAETVGCPIPWC